MFAENTQDLIRLIYCNFSLIYLEVSSSYLALPLSTIHKFTFFVKRFLEKLASGFNTSFHILVLA